MGKELSGETTTLCSYKHCSDHFFSCYFLDLPLFLRLIVFTLSIFLHLLFATVYESHHQLQCDYGESMRLNGVRFKSGV